MLTQSPSLLKRIALQLAPFIYEYRTDLYQQSRISKTAFTAFIQTYADFEHNLLIDEEIKTNKSEQKIERNQKGYNLLQKLTGNSKNYFLKIFFGLPVLSEKFLDNHQLSPTLPTISEKETKYFLWRDFLGWPSNEMVKAKKITLFNKFQYELSQRSLRNLYRVKAVLTLQPLRNVLFGIIIKSFFNIIRLPLTYLPCLIKVALENSIAYLIEPEHNAALKITGVLLVPFYYLTSAIHLITRAVLFPLKSMQHAYKCGEYIGGKPLGIFFGFISAAISFAAVAFMPYAISQNIEIIIVLLNKFIAPNAMLVLNNIVIWSKAKVTAASLVTAGAYSLSGLILTAIFAGPLYLLKMAIKIEDINSPPPSPTFKPDDIDFDGETGNISPTGGDPLTRSFGSEDPGRPTSEGEGEPIAATRVTP